MAFKFFGQPNMLVKTRKRIPFETKIDFKPLFRFDDKGEYITDDIYLIEKLKSRFDHLELIVSDEKKKDEELPFEEKTEAYIASYEDDNKKESKFKCKKCNFETNSKGSLMAHYRTHK